MSDVVYLHWFAKEMPAALTSLKTVILVTACRLFPGACSLQSRGEMMRCLSTTARTANLERAPRSRNAVGTEKSTNISFGH